MPKKPKGNETSRAEAITMRVSPKLRYGVELLCRKQHRNITSVMEWAIDRILSDEKDGLLKVAYDIDDGETFIEADLDKLWSVDEIQRLLNLVGLWPSLMTYEEEYLWDLISNGRNYWLSDLKHSNNGRVSWEVIYPFRFLNKSALRKDWETLKAISNGEKSLSELKEYIAADSRSGSLRSCVEITPKKLDLLHPNHEVPF